MSKNALFEKWCERACGYIYYPPDRAEVEQELMWHLEDTAEGFVEGGMDSAEAEAKALEAMGSPDDVGRLLRRVHKPWLGWACRVMAPVTLLMVIVFFAHLVGTNGWFHIKEEAEHLFRPEMNYETYHEALTEYSLGEYVYPELLAEAEPGGTVKCGIYTFQITGGWIEKDERGNYGLRLVLSYSSPRFWAGPPKLDYLRVETSGGQVIRAHMPGSPKLVIGNFSGSGTAFGERVLEMDVEPGTEWVDIINEFGEGFDLRVYLPEGGDWA